MAGDVGELRAALMQKAVDLGKLRLKQRWLQLRHLLSELPEKPPSEEEAQQIITALIRERKATFTRDGQSYGIDLGTLDEKIAALKSSNPSMGALLGNMGSVADEVPTEATLNNISDAIARGVESASGGLSKTWNFVQSVGIFLFNWIKSVFTGEKAPGFWETVAQVSAPSVRDSVRQELTTLAANDSAAARLLYQQDDSGRSNMDVIGDMTQAGTYKKLDVAPPAAATPPPPLRYDDVAPLPANVPDATALRMMIRGQLLTPGQGKPSLAQEIETRLKAKVSAYKASQQEGFFGFITGRVANAAAPNDQDIKLIAQRMAEKIADRVSSVVTDPAQYEREYKNKYFAGKALTALTQQDFQDGMANAVGDGLVNAERENQLGIPAIMRTVFSLSDRDANGRSALEEIEDQVRKKAGEKYQQLQPILQAMAPRRSPASTPPAPPGATDAGANGVPPASPPATPPVPGGAQGKPR